MGGAGISTPSQTHICTHRVSSVAAGDGDGKMFFTPTAAQTVSFVSSFIFQPRHTVSVIFVITCNPGPSHVRSSPVHC